MGILGTVTKQQFELIPPGEYVFTLNDVTEEDGQFGDALKWVFLMSPTDAPNDYLLRNDGNEKSLFQYTNADVTEGSRALEWIEALAGRSFGVDEALPDESTLLGKRMLAYLTHYAPKKGKNAGVKREKIVEGSAKPWRGRQAGPAPMLERQPPAESAPVIAQANEVAAAATVAQPVAPEVTRESLLKEAKKLARRAAVLDLDGVERWSAVDPAMLDTDALVALTDEIQTAIEAEATAVVAGAR